MVDKIIQIFRNARLKLDKTLAISHVSAAYSLEKFYHEMAQVRILES